MSDGKVVSITGDIAPEAREPRQDVIDACADLLEMARVGELQGLVCALQFADGSAGVSRGGTSTFDLIGALEEAKFRMLAERNEE